MFTGNKSTTIKAIGIGEAGCQIIDKMMSYQIDDIEYICADSNRWALSKLDSCTKLQLSSCFTAADANADMSSMNIDNDRQLILNALLGADLVFIISAIDIHGSSTGATIIAELCRHVGAVALIATTDAHQFIPSSAQDKPTFMKVADTVIMTQCDGSSLSPATAMSQNSRMNVFDHVSQAVRAITEVILRSSLIVVDFTDVRLILNDHGKGRIGTALATGNNRASEATTKALCSILSEGDTILLSSGIFIVVSANEHLGVNELSIVCETISRVTSGQFKVLIGVTIDPSFRDEMMVTVVT